jgi:hypothetical protein
VIVYDRYNSWFRSTFGQDSDAVAVGFARMSHVLIGPAPAMESRQPYRGLSGATVMLAPTEKVFFATSPDDYAAKIRELIASQ